MADQGYEISFDVEIGDAVSAKVAEAWAVGQRGGVDVGSSDPTYHNNAKYYAEKTAEDRAATSGATAAVAEYARQAAASALEAAGYAQAAEIARAAAEAAVQEVLDAIVAAQGYDMLRMDANGDFFVLEEDE